MVNMVNATFPELFTSPVFFFGMQMWHLPSLPYNYSSVFTHLQHICKEHICAKIIISSSACHYNKPECLVVLCPSVHLPVFSFKHLFSIYPYPVQFNGGLSFNIIQFSF